MYVLENRNLNSPKTESTIWTYENMAHFRPFKNP